MTAASSQTNRICTSDKVNSCNVQPPACNILAKVSWLMRATPEAPTMMQGSSVSLIADWTFRSLIAVQYCFSRSSSCCSIGPSAISSSSSHQRWAYIGDDPRLNQACNGFVSVDCSEQQQTAPHSGRYRFGPRRHPQLLEQQLEVRLHSVGGN